MFFYASIGKRMENIMTKEEKIERFKKMNENMFLSKSGLDFCFIFFIALPVGASLAFIFIFLLVLSIISQIIKCMQKK